MGVPQKVGTHTEHYRRKPDHSAYRIFNIGIRNTLQSGMGAMGALCSCGRLSALFGIERASTFLFPDCPFAIGSIGFLYSSNYVFDNILESISKSVSRLYSVWKKT